MHSSSIAVLVVAFLGLHLTALAEPGDVPTEGLDIIRSFYPAPGTCEPSTTPTVELDDLLADAEPFQKQCVRTTGYFLGDALLAESPGKTAQDRRLGVYGSIATMAELRQIAGQYVEVTGVISDCASLRSGGAMVMGYCHSADGVIIGIEKYKLQ